MTRLSLLLGAAAMLAFAAAPVAAQDLPLSADPVQPAVDDITWGDDSSQYANDNECDDPRFTGPGIAPPMLPDDALADATDCRSLYESGTVFLRRTDIEPSQSMGMVDGIDFGTNEGDYPFDSECDDPRFQGVTDAQSGMAMELSDTNSMRDGMDCLELYQAGRIQLK